MALTYKDTTGQWWQIIVNPDGSLSQVPTSSGFPTNPGDEATVQLQNTVNLC
ncbi:MAG: hypothetical protein ACXVZV_02835 [Terriglobales bacterium]